MLADISTPMTGGAFVDPTTGYGIMSDIPGGGMQSALDASKSFTGAATAGPGAATGGSDQDSLLGQIGPDGEKFDYSTDDIFGDLTPEQLAVQEYVSGLKAGTPAADIVSQARSAALAPTPVEKQAPVGIETVKSVMDTPDSTQAERAAAAAAVAASLTPDDIVNKVAGGSGFSTRPGSKPGESVLNIDGVEYSFDNRVPGDQRTYSPVEKAGITAARDVTPGAQGLSPEAQAAVDALNAYGGTLDKAREGIAGIRDTLSGMRAGLEDEPIGGAIDVQSVIDEAKSNVQQNISSGSPTPSTVESVAASAPTQEDIDSADNFADISTIGPDAGKAAPSNIDAETGLPISVRQANAPTFGKVPNYDETDYLDLGTGKDLISARQDAVDAALAQAKTESPINTGIGIVDDIYNSIMAPNTTAKNMVTEDGGLVAYSTTPTQDVIGVVDPGSGNIQPTRDNFFNTELNPVYDQYGRGPEGGDNGGGDQTTMPTEVALDNGYCSTRSTT
jgi:hypothetical protein